MVLDDTHGSEVTVCGLVVRSRSGTRPDGYQTQDQQDEAQTQTRQVQTETESGARKSGQFEFVLMGSDGGLNKGGISQIRAHTTREMHKARRISGQTFSRRRQDAPGNIFFGSEIDAFRALPQLPVETYKPKVFDEIKRNVFHVFNQKLMKESVWPHGARDDAFFAGMMLMCSVHLDSMNSDKPSAVTTAIKLEAMKLVRGRMGSSSGDMMIGCISAIACLASTALVRGGAEGAEEYLIHRKAYAVLINDVFRQQKFETSRFYKDVLKVITMILISRRCRMPVAGLAPLADSATTLKEYEHVFEDVAQTRIRPDPELYSPVYDGRTHPVEDPFPHIQREHLLLLVQMMQSVISIWLRQTTDDLRPEDETLALSALCARILDMPSARKKGLACSNDYMYEACRLTSVLMVQSVEQYVSWRDAAQGTTLVAEMRAALAKTELDGLWGRNIGLLYWVVLVFHCAAFETSDYPFAHALQTRIHFQLTYNYRDWHGAVRPMLVLKDVMCLPESGQI